MHTLDDEFVRICTSILAEGKSVSAWAEIEADDMFQTKHYVGGFDATEMEFCFSVYDDGKEYWFQLSLDSIAKVVDGQVTEVEVREAEM